MVHIVFLSFRKNSFSSFSGDFDGDGGMDIMVVTKDIQQENEDKLQVIVLWGEHNYKTGEHTLLCSKAGTHNPWDHFIEMDSQPLVLDGDGDNIADLFGSVNDTIGMWLFKQDRKSAPYYVILKDEVEVPFSNPHSNSLVDLNGDGNADLFLTTEKGFEIWENVGGRSSNHFEYHSSIAYPVICTADVLSDCIGHVVFADFDLNGRIDLLFPACQNNCEESLLYFTTLESLWHMKKKGFEVTSCQS